MLLTRPECNPGFQRLFPAKRAKTPPVTGPEAWKPGFGTRCAQVVAARSDHNTLEWEKKGKSEFHHERALALLPSMVIVLALKGNVRVGEDRH
jgi:hypothetical protein